MSSTMTEHRHLLEADESWANRQLSHHHQKKKRQKQLNRLYTDPGIASDTFHGLLMDAGSTGSRLHIYEWSNDDDHKGLRVPGTDTRWTDRLRPGLSSFSTITDTQELTVALRNYFAPLLEFATTVLHDKKHKFDQFPLYLYATAGMRVLPQEDRQRLLSVTKKVLTEEWPFAARQIKVISGEEEALFDWLGVNFVLNPDNFKLLEGGDDRTGRLAAPSASPPSAKTYGALDLGGASTQIAFWPEEVMSNWVPLRMGPQQIDLYAHSFLMYGMNEAIHRFGAERIGRHHNPCASLPWTVPTHNIHYDTEAGIETWAKPGGDSTSSTTLPPLPNVDNCFVAVKRLLHLERTDWCAFAHRGDCSLAGIYQAPLPTDMEWIAFSNYAHVWSFLKLEERATVGELEAATRSLCSLQENELLAYNLNHQQPVTKEELPTYCFRAAYAWHLLHEGYGFSDDTTIRAVAVLDGQKVDWALGAMLYQLNTDPALLPSSLPSSTAKHAFHLPEAPFLWVAFVLAAALCMAGSVYRRHLRRKHVKVWEEYEPIVGVDKLNTYQTTLKV